MNIETFTKLFAEQFDDSDHVNFQSNTEFKQLDEWSSLMSLIIIMMIKDNYNTTISGEDIKNANIIEDLYKIVLSQQ